MDMMWSTEYGANGKTYRFYTIGSEETGHEDNLSTLKKVVGVDERAIYKTRNKIVQTYTDNFIKEVKENGYTIR